MNTYYEYKTTYNQITFQLTNKQAIEDREIHAYHEILFYMDDVAELLTTKGHLRLKKNSLIIIPEETYHFLNRQNTSGFARLKISFPSNTLSDTPLPSIMHEIRIMDDLGDEITFILDKLCHILRENKAHTSFYAYSAFLMLVAELDAQDFRSLGTFHTKTNHLIASLTEYISQNLSADLDIKSLAKIMHISPSGITHLFKKEFGISVHKYIIQKRLVYAKKLLSEGAQPSKIYSQIGFKDYSSFYKAYINYFGYSPSKE